MRALAILGLVFVAAGASLSVPIWPAIAQSQNEVARCQSIESAERRLACMNAISRRDAVTPRQALPPRPTIVRANCHQDFCLWLRLISQATIQSSEKGVLIKALIETGESSHPNGSYERSQPIQWTAPGEGYAFCSKTRPAILYHSDKGWITDILSPGYPDGVYGANTSSYAEYFLICHGLTNVDLYDKALGPKLGYSAELVARVEQLTLAAPTDIIRDPKATAQPNVPKPSAADNAEFAAKLNVPFMQARACIRSNVLAAYQSGVYGNDQVTAFFANRCLAQYSAGLRDLGMDNEMATIGFKVLVLQEIAPEAWQKSLDDLKRGAGQ